MSLSRRRFLSTGAQALVGATIGVQGLAWLTGCSSSTTTDPQGIWTDLAQALTGTLLLPGSMDYLTKARPWALQYAGTVPAGIAQVASEQDVQTCIAWARKNNIAFVARSGGHSYAAYSTTSGLLIDVSAMNTVTIDTDGTAHVGGGARNKDVYAALRAPSVAITHGRCKEVGVAGLVLGGGIGFNMRAHGLTCDRLIATRIVLADGRVVNCSDAENADLFWAIRGAGGGNFGIHTAFTFRPFPVSNIVVFSITWSTNLEAIFTALQTMALNAPTTLGLKVSVIAAEQGGVASVSVNILGQLVGSEADLASLLAPIQSIAAPSASTIRTMSYWDGQEFLSEEGDPEYSHERSRFAFGALSEQAIAAIFRNMAAWPGSSVAGTWKYFLMGGVIDDKAATDTAFVHRKATMITSIDIEWLPTDGATRIEQNYAWLDAFHAEMAAHTSPQCYQNFIDRRETSYLDAYYGTNLEKLKTVKRTYDPTNVFTYPQGIPPA